MGSYSYDIAMDSSILKYQHIQRKPHRHRPVSSHYQDPRTRCLLLLNEISQNWFPWILPKFIRKTLESIRRTLEFICSVVAFCRAVKARVVRWFRGSRGVPCTPKPQKSGTGHYEQVLSACKGQSYGILEENGSKTGVDSAHCAGRPDLDECGDCQCSITCGMPGRFPQEVCGECVIKEKEEELIREEFEREQYEWDRSVGPFIHFPLPSPVSSEDEEDDKYTDEEEDDIEEDCCEDYKEDCYEECCNNGGNTPRSYSDPSTQTHHHISSEGSEELRRPRWMRSVRWRRPEHAEEYITPSPPPPKSTKKPKRYTTKFTPWFFKIPYYRPEWRRFAYADPGYNLKNLVFKFKKEAPPTIPIYRKGPKKTKTRKSKKAEPNIADYRLSAQDFPATSTLEQSSGVTLRPSGKRIIMDSINIITMSDDEWPNDPDTPSPPSSKDRMYVPKSYDGPGDNEGDYQPSSSEESEVEQRKAPVPAQAIEKKKKKRRRRRRNSDLAYRQHGVRENNRIEKGDLEKMRQEEEKQRIEAAKRFDEARRNNELEEDDLKKIHEEEDRQRRKAARRFAEKRAHEDMMARQYEAKNKARIDAVVEEHEIEKRNEIRKGKQKADEYFKREEPPKQYREYDQSRTGLYDPPADFDWVGDGDFLPSFDSDEERQEMEDVQLMENDVRQDLPNFHGAEEYLPSQTPARPPDVGGKENHRRRIPIEDRAYQPGRNMGIRGTARGHGLPR